MTAHRAYSTFTIKNISEDTRTIEGIASTPTPDRMNDIVELDGIQFDLPMPFLYQHDSSQPIGNIVAAKKTKDGLMVKAQMAGDIGVEYINTAWKLIKAGLVRGFSIGFRSIEEAYNKDTGGFRFIKTELYEISAVTIPANAEATILTVKSADAVALAASGRERSTSVRLDITAARPAVVGPTSRDTMKTITDQIAGSEAKLTANEARIDAIIEKTMDESRTPEQDETTEIETLRSESKRLTDYIALLKSRESEQIKKAQRVTVDAVRDDDGGKRLTSVSSEPITLRSNAPKGINMARMVIALVRSKNNPFVAMELAKQHWPDAPEVALTIKAAIDAGDTTTSGWASQLVPSAQQLQGEFLSLFMPQTIIGRLPGVRKVPFNIAVPIETASGTVQWVGEGAPKPVTKLTLTNKTLTWAKAAAIVAITKELARFSSPDAEMVVRDSMTKTLIKFFDTTFVSATAAVSGVSPAGIRNGISSTSTSGVTAAAMRTDLTTLIQKLTVNSVPLDQIVLLMSATQAAALQLMVTDLGIHVFDSITRTGGTLEGFPVIVSETVGNNIIALNTQDVLLASDPGVQIDVSDTASVEMSDTPLLGDESPVITASTIYKSAFQNNLIFIRVEQYITWALARAASCEWLTTVAYKG